MSGNLDKLDSPGNNYYSFFFCGSVLLIMRSNTSFRRGFGYNKLPPQLLVLSVLKLDGSRFDVEIVRTATVAELKQAVEQVFSQFPQNTESIISWSHVWGHFCLSYKGQKLIDDYACIRHFGIKDGDQLRFVQNIN